MSAGEPIVVWRDPNAPDTDPNYPGNPDPSDPIPTWSWDWAADEVRVANYHKMLEAWLKRHPEFTPEPGFS